jgi:hypothetical protein
LWVDTSSAVAAPKCRYRGQIVRTTLDYPPEAPLTNSPSNLRAPQLPGPVVSQYAMPEQDEYLCSPVVSQATTASFGVGTNLTWDSFWRQVYENSNKVIQRQANDLLKRGNLVEAEVRALVEGQRNALVLKIRQYNSPFGRLYSEILKPSSKLPTLERLVAQRDPGRG